MPGKDSKYIEFTKWRNRGRGTMGEFKFKDTVENLKTNLLDNLGLWVPTAIAANGKNEVYSGKNILWMHKS